MNSGTENQSGDNRDRLRNDVNNNSTPTTPITTEEPTVSIVTTPPPLTASPILTTESPTTATIEPSTLTTPQSSSILTTPQSSSILTTTESSSTAATTESTDQLSTLGQLFQACINSDITTMENIIKAFETKRESVINGKSSSMVDTCDSEEDEYGYFDGEFYYNHPLIEHRYNIDQLYDIPQIEDLYIANSLLDAAVLSNLPTTIDFVFKVCKLEGYGHISFWERNSDYSLGIGQSALLLALVTDKLDSVKHLIDKYSARFTKSIKEHSVLEYLLHPDRFKQLQLFVQHSSVALHLLTDCEDNYDYLIHAIKSRDNELIQYIVDLGVSIDTRDYYGHSALYTYAHNFQWDMVEYLISHFRADWNLRCQDYESEKCRQSLLSVALSDPNLTIETFDFIINHIGVEFRDHFDEDDEFDGQTPLLLTAKRGKLSFVERLINHHNANINVACSQHRTLLHYAVKSNNLHLIKYIVIGPMFNFNINTLDNALEYENHSYTPLSMNIHHISLDVVKFMVQHKSDIRRDTHFELDEHDDNFQLPPALILPLAARNPDSHVIEYLFEQVGIDQLTRDELGQSLINSIGFKRLHTAQLLIEKYNANRNYSFSNGNIFHYTLQYNNVGSSIRQFIDFLQPTKEELEATNSKGDTPLLIAVKSHCDVECLDILVEFGANIHVNNKINNENVFHAVLLSQRAFEHGPLGLPIRLRVKVLQYFIDSNVDIDGKCSTTGQTPLHYAAKIKNSDYTQFLLTNGANINQVDLDSNTPLGIAVIKNNIEPFRALITNGADVNIQNKKGQTAIHLAASYFHSQLITLLSTSTSNINIKDQNGNTPLLLVPVSASLSYNEFASATMKSLLHNQSDPTIMNNKGQTILHLIACTQHQDLEISTSLIDLIIDCIDEPIKNQN